MLFYKRVEPEDDNGKDFSFDVSPDLLEVLTVLFCFKHSRSLCITPIKSPFKCPTLYLFQWIWHDNMQFLQDKNIFEHTYFG